MEVLGDGVVTGQGSRSYIQIRTGVLVGTWPILKCSTFGGGRSGMLGNILRQEKH